MKNSFYKNRDYYPDNSRSLYSNAKSNTDRKYNLSSSKVSQGKTKLENRIEKACQNNTTQSYRKETILLKKQIERLQKQLLKKDNKMFQMQSAHHINKQLSSEIEQTYRIIYMYQGKIQELQKQLKRIQKKLSQFLDRNGPIGPQEVEDLLNSYRIDNTELRGLIEEQNRTILELQNRLQTIQSKYFNTSWKLSTQVRSLQNPLKKNFPKLRDTIVIQDMSLAERQKMIGDIDYRYRQIGKNAQYLVKQNQLLKKQAGQKQRKIQLYKRHSQSIRSSQNLINLPESHQKALSPNQNNKYSKPSYTSSSPLIQKIDLPLGHSETNRNYKYETIKSNSRPSGVTFAINSPKTENYISVQGDPKSTFYQAYEYARNDPIKIISTSSYKKNSGNLQQDYKSREGQSRYLIETGNVKSNSNEYITPGGKYKERSQENQKREQNDGTKKYINIY